MQPDVKAPRPYRSPRRRAQAEATRVEIVDAAHRLFVARGYVATTLADIADTAGVSVPTVKLAYRTKRLLLMEAWKHAVTGADPRPAAEQEWFARMLAAPDPREHLRLKVAGSVAVSGRVAPLVEVIRAAAQADDEIAVVWDSIQADSRNTQRLTVQALQRKGRLRDGLAEDEAADLLYTLNHGTYHTLVGRLGWSAQRYAEWLTQTLIEQLLAPPEVDRSTAREEASSS